MRRDSGTVAFDHLLVEAFHVVGMEGWLQSCHLIEDTPQRPDIGLVVVGLVLPDLRRGVVGRAGLGVEEPFFGDLGDVHVAQLDRAILVEEDVGRLHVSVVDFEVVEGLESVDHLNENVPDFLFLEQLAALLMPHDLLIEVSMITKLHDNT